MSGRRRVIDPRPKQPVQIEAGALRASLDCSAELEQLVHGMDAGQLLGFAAKLELWLREARIWAAMLTTGQGSASALN